MSGLCVGILPEDADPESVGTLEGLRGRCLGLRTRDNSGWNPEGGIQLNRWNMGVLADNRHLTGIRALFDLTRGVKGRGSFARIKGREAHLGLLRNNPQDFRIEDSEIAHVGPQIVQALDAAIEEYGVERVVITFN